MFIKKTKFLIFIFLIYQTPLYSKSNSFDTRNLSKYFSGIVAYENEDNSSALNFFSTSKILIKKHEPFFKRYIYTLVLENKVLQAINVVKNNKEKKNSNFFEAHLLLILDSIKKNDFNKANMQLINAEKFTQEDDLNLAIFETLKQYIFTFKEKKILKDKKKFGNLSLISETFQRCYLNDTGTDTFFSNLINNYKKIDYTRYSYFYLSYLIENQRLDDANKNIKNIEYLNSTLLLSQGKSWIENKNFKKFYEIFSCKNHNDIISEFFFLISNLYSSEGNFEKSNFYLNFSYFLNPKFTFNLSLGIENYYQNKNYDKAKKTLKLFKKEDNFYYWYRKKKEAQIIAKQVGKSESLNYIVAEFNKIDEPNEKFLFDIANFYKNSKEYEKAIKYYSKVLEKIDDSSKIKSDVLYRRGSSYERLGKYEKADIDFFNSLLISPNDAYVLNYLAYSWLERDYKINEAIKMLETAYASKSNDPYIIDSIGWAYYLINDYVKAEKFLKKAVELMPDDPIVNDHYGDILWKLNRKIQARYFWANVLNMEDTEEEMKEKINAKIINGLNIS
ncbi:hypothetical protein IDG49_00205 [Pelagibacterales bacterium SAG-MED07]|nr:hypothetical protein [Pelagibacterales bacterium SAG-MED07]